MKELSEDLEKQFTCFGENNEECLSLTLPIEKEVTKIDKNWEEKLSKKFDEKFKEWFFNTYKVFNHDNNKFILLLQKDVCPYDYIDD